MEYTKTAYGLNRLKGSFILSNSNRVMGKDIETTSDFSKGSSSTDGWTEVINDYNKDES